MRYPTFHDPLFGNEVEIALASLPPDVDTLAAVTQLNARLGSDLGRRAARLHELRLRSKAKFPAGLLPFLTRKGLEQASAWPVAKEL